MRRCDAEYGSVDVKDGNAGDADEKFLIAAEDWHFEWMLKGRPAAQHGIRLPAGGVDEPVVLEIVRGITRQLREASCAASWLMVYDGEIVGLCSYRRPPKEGSVEIGYGTSGEHRRMGHATRAVAAMVRYARNDAAIREITAETSVANPASGRVLEKNGFERVGFRIDPEDGEVVRWRKTIR